jgi:hypothetical protein
LLDEIEDQVKEGGYIIDWHACDLFPKSWIDLVVVLRASSKVLYDRLEQRYVTGALTFDVATAGMATIEELTIYKTLSGKENAREYRRRDYAGYS